MSLSSFILKIWHAASSCDKSCVMLASCQLPWALSTTCGKWWRKANAGLRHPAGVGPAPSSLHRSYRGEIEPTRPSVSAACMRSMLQIEQLATAETLLAACGSTCLGSFCSGGLLETSPAADLLRTAVWCRSLYLHSDLRGFKPSETTYIFFGRRGSGKTTIRLQMEAAFRKANEEAIASGRSRGHFMVDMCK